MIRRQAVGGFILPGWALGPYLAIKFAWWCLKVFGRYVSGRPLDGRPRTNGTFTERGTVALDRDGRAAPELHPSRWSMLPGLQRALWRMLVPPALVAALAAYAAYPTAIRTALYLGAGYGTFRLARAGRRRWRGRRFRRVYLRPLSRVVGPLVGQHIGTRIDAWLTVSPELGALTPRLVKPMSPVEIRVRTVYAERVEPVMKWLPDRIMLAYWMAYLATEPLRTRTVTQLRRPAVEHGPRVEIRTAPHVFVTEDLKKAIRAAVVAKLGLGDLIETWDQIGESATGIWTIRKRPPEKVGMEEIAEKIDTLDEHEFLIGLGAENRPVVVSVDDDSPHIACSAGSGAGKSVLAMLIAVQVLRRGGRVLILDRKGSHRWALGLTGVTYCTQPADMHAALIGASSLADERNTEALTQPEGWDPGARLFVIFEEMNATVAMLKQYWEDSRDSGDPKTSPAITAFRNLMYMGRSAKCNLFGVAQMLSANTTGGPEARENFGIRCLARYTANNWKMLCPETPMPRKSKTRGRWQVVVAGEATETQVAFLHTDEARRLAEPRVPVSPWPGVATVDQGRPDGTRRPSPRPRPPVESAPEPVLADPYGSPVSLREAVDAGILRGKYDAVRKRLQRARDAGELVPRIVGRKGRADLYKVADLIEWAHTSGIDVSDDLPAAVENK